MTENEQYDSLDIYLKKDNKIIGLHAIGCKGPYEFTLVDLDGSSSTITSDFQVFEMWGNEYNERFEMIGRGSFRVFGYSLEFAAEAYEADGWIRFERKEL